MTSTIALFINDADHALAHLPALLQQHPGSRWIVVACPPRLTRHIGKHASHASRRQWRGEWCERLFQRVLPALGGAATERLIADVPLLELVRRLQGDHGEALQIADARRPRLGEAPAPLKPSAVPARQWALPVLVGSGVGIALAALAD